MDSMDMNHVIENAEKEYRIWRDQIQDSEEYYEELCALEENEEERMDSFYTHLKFGTSGMRGLLGPGTNRINARVIRRASQGLANYMNERFEAPKVVIAYDSRKGSRYYAQETAAVLNGNGITVHLFQEITPVPALSYTIKALGCSMGVMITASHNPKRYNGYKVYNQDGYQIIGDDPKDILAEIEKLDFFDESIQYDLDGILPIGPEIREQYCRTIAGLSTQVPQETLNQMMTIYTPLNGAGNAFVKEVFSGIGYTSYRIVRSQEYPDEKFPTCPQPNPEKILAFNEAFRLLDDKGGDLILATDPDADRIGAALYHDGMRSLLSGNQMGLLIFDYLCQVRPPKPGQRVYKSIASSPLAEDIADKYGLTVVNTLTGFKYIGDQVTQLEKAGQEDLFYYGFEESNGYLIDSFVHEKDGISGAMITVEMAAYWKAKGMDLIDRLQQLYNDYGTCIDKTRNYFFDGMQGKLQMDAMMEHFRTDGRNTIGDLRITHKIDYQKPSQGEPKLPKANVVQWDLEDGSRLVIRPSGTEPKLKIYSFEKGDISSVERELIRIIEQFKTITF